MNPLRVSARHYRSFAELELEIPNGCVAVVGENGAGKSSIVNLIDLCLFGSRSLSGYISDTAVEEQMEIGLEFEHRGNLYRIRRTYSARGRGKASLDFERWDDGVAYDHGRGDHEPDEYLAAAWLAQTRETAAATQELIEQTIGLSRETFRASAFLAQGDGAAFTEAQPRERKAILAEVLGLEIWERLLEKVRRDTLGLRDEKTRLAIQVEEADVELEQLGPLGASISAHDKTVGETELQLREAEAGHTQAAEKLAASREVAAKLEAAREVLASRERELNQVRMRQTEIGIALKEAEGLPQLKAEAEGMAARKDEIETELAHAVEAETARNEHRRLTAERDRLIGEEDRMVDRVFELRGMAETVEPDEATCDRCEQLLGKDAAARAIKSYNAEADALHEQAKKLKAEADALLPDIDLNAGLAASGPNASQQATLEAALRNAREAEKTLAGIEERVKRAEELQSEGEGLTAMQPTLQQSVAQSRADLTALEQEAPSEDLEAGVARAYGTLLEARSQAEGAKQRRAVAEAELKRLKVIEERTAENRKALADHETTLDELAVAERAYGKDGIPALIIENAAIPQIELEASRILSELGTSLRIELRTQREKKDGSGLTEALDIMVIGAAGERAYESFSGGERTRLNLALRIALARLLAHRRGAEVRMLAIDEPEFLDEAGVSRLADVLRGLAGDFDKVLLISHVPTLATSFDQTLTVVKDEGGSRIEEQLEVAAVVA